MKPKLLMTPLGQYEHVQWNGKNTSGITPIGDRVLILPDCAVGVTSGNVHIPQELQERMSMAAESGVLVAVGDGAWFWNSDRTRRFEGTRPTAGQRVYFERYAGAVHHGKDGKMYRLADDKVVGGLSE